MGLSAGRPQPAGLLIFSGFIPAVGGWEADLSRSDRPVFIAHGRRDPVMNVEFARAARDLLEGAGFGVEYHESDAAHFIDPNHVPAAVRWLSDRL
jgi:phospholipase/carboxylesterase